MREARVVCVLAWPRYQRAELCKLCQGAMLSHPSCGQARRRRAILASNLTCPVRTMQAWIEQAAITAGPVFRSINRHGHVKAGRLSGIDVARVVKKLVDRAGLDASKYAGHSLRAGHATSAAIAGASERSIMNQTGHRSVQMVRRYIRDGSLFRENSAGKLGL